MASFSGAVSVVESVWGGVTVEAGAFVVLVVAAEVQIFDKVEGTVLGMAICAGVIEAYTPGRDPNCKGNPMTGAFREAALAMTN